MVKAPLIPNGIALSRSSSSSMESLNHQEEDLLFTDKMLQEDTLAALNMMRKNRHFCDVILHIGSTEIHAHRAVLASMSPYLFELFSSEEKRIENVITYKLNGGFDKSAFQLLVDYAYTGNLEVPYNQVKAVYIAARHLKIDRVTRKCAQHLINYLSIDNSIEIRSLPGISKSKDFIQQVDTFIANNFDEISQNSHFLNLNCARIEVLNQSKEEMSLVISNSLCRLVLEWIKRQVTEDNLSLASLSDNTFMLYLAIDNSLQDCNSLPTGDVCDTDIVQDYKKLSSKNNVNQQSKGKRKQLGQPSKPRVLIYSREIGEELESEMEPHWNLIATSKVAEHSYVALVTLAGKLAKLSIQLRLNVPTTPSPVATPDALKSSYEDKPDLYYTLANMSSARCAVGCGNLNDTLIVCGGYDRVECLRSVEQYIPETNKWFALPQMRQGRGRFQIAILDSKVYAIGGSNGTTELDTVEMLDMDVGKWTQLPKLSLARSNPGVCDLDNLVYCIGGWNGQVGTKQCDVFDPTTKSWSPIAPMNTGRYQAGVTAYNGLVYAIGGCDAWNCLSSVEAYDPKTDSWTPMKPMITARRGCGVAVFNGKLYIVGGSDGSHTLNTTEVFDINTQTWEVGPTMTTPRANVEVAVVGNKLYAVGGFSGKSFLNTIEYLDPSTNEWTTFIPREEVPPLDNCICGNGSDQE